MSSLEINISQACKREIAMMVVEEIRALILPQQEYYTVKEFAYATSYSETYIREKMNSGFLTRDGGTGTIRFHKSELQKFRRK
jgi:hypothetical protein